MEKTHLPKYLEGIIAPFFESVGNDIDSIEEALKSNNFIEIRSKSHQLEGSGGSYNLSKISDYGIAINMAAKKQNTNEIIKQTGLLKEYMKNLDVICDLDDEDDEEDEEDEF